MTQTITLTETTGTLGLDPVWRSSPFVLTGTVSNPALSTWKAQLWRRPQDVNDEDAEPLAIAVGSVSSGTLRLAFTAANMAVDLEAGNGAYDDLWLVIGGVATDGQGTTVLADWLRVMEGGFSEDAYPETGTTFTVVDDVAYFEYDGQTYARPVTPTDTPPGAVEGGVIVVDDTMILTLGGVSYASAVTPIESIPPTENTENVTDYITGSDGATYERTVTPDGQIYYKPVFTEAP